MILKSHVFREYDIRGIAGTDIDGEFMGDLGRALGSYLQDKGKKLIAVGRDCRLSSPEYYERMMEGFLSSGCDVLELGLVPTPLVYFSVFHFRAGAGIQVTGSHNPPEYNGVKISLGEQTVHGEELKKLYALMETKRFLSGKGKKTRVDVESPYIEKLCGDFQSLAGLSVAVDCANGAASVMAPRLLEELGVKFFPLYCDFDGRFPNHPPDPTVPEHLAALRQLTVSQRCHAGFGFDGDGDRLGVVDDAGGIIYGDKLLILFSKSVLEDYPGATVIGEVKCSQTFLTEIQKAGGNPILWKTGHSLIRKKMKEEKAMLAGEMSGHFFFADRYYGYDDALYAACRLLEILTWNKGNLSSLLRSLPQTYSTPEIRVPCSEETKWKIVQKAQDYFGKHYKTMTIDGVRIQFEDGWGLIRASNTQPVLVLRFESSSSEGLQRIQSLVQDKLSQL